MKRFHLIFGVLLFTAFTVTGRLMRVDFPDKEMIPQDLRLLMRSRHIYILFSSFLHLLLGVYLQMSPLARQRIFQYAASAVLFASSIVLVAGWYAETYLYAHFSDISRWGIYLSLAGVGLHLVSGLARSETSPDVIKESNVD